MSAHVATIEWNLDGDFAANRYSRAHVWRFDGGAEIPASSSPHVVPVPLADASGVDPEEALVAAAASCHMLWFLHLARDAGFVVVRYEDEARGVMGKDERARVAMLRIELRPAIAFEGVPPDAARVAALHEAAHQRCFIANSLRSDVVVVPSGRG